MAFAGSPKAGVVVYRGVFTETTKSIKALQWVLLSFYGYDGL